MKPRLAYPCLTPTDPFARGQGDIKASGQNGLAALLGNQDQNVLGETAYPTSESKAAHHLYFVTNNHPFADGNKRIGSFLFVDFLNRNGRLFRAGEALINDVGLAALALLVAESAPRDKELTDFTGDEHARGAAAMKPYKTRIKRQIHIVRFRSISDWPRHESR